MSNRFIEFIYDKTLKRPKKLRNIVFVLYSPERIRLQPGELKNVDMKLSIRLQNEIIATCVLLPSFSKNGLDLEKCQYISVDNNINNLNQPINLLRKLQLELVDRNMNTCLFNTQETGNWFITTLNEGLEQLEVKYTKT